MCIYVKFIPIYVFMQRFHYFFSLEVVCLSRLLLANKFYMFLPAGSRDQRCISISHSLSVLCFICCVCGVSV